MRKIDRAALELALEQTLAEKDQGRVDQVRSMLQGRTRLEVSQFCSFHRQIEALKLKPWEVPPCCVSMANPDNDNAAAMQLLKRMRACGVSKWHPNPILACEAAEKAAGPPADPEN
jgi:hypothetical protein